MSKTINVNATGEDKASGDGTIADVQLSRANLEIARLKGIIAGLECETPLKTPSGTYTCTQRWQIPYTHLRCQVCRAKLDAGAKP